MARRWGTASLDATPEGGKARLSNAELSRTTSPSGSSLGDTACDCRGKIGAVDTGLALLVIVDSGISEERMLALAEDATAG